MRRERLDSIMRWCRSWQALSTRRVKGQIAVYMAVMLTSLMGLAGAGVDYGLIVIESSRLQNALDAAALAGARALVLSTASTQGAATNPASGTRNYDGQQAAIAFLSSNGYTNGANGATFTFTPTAGVTGAPNDTMQVSGTVVKPTSFWKVIGINSTTITQSATAASTGGMVDVMLSLDLTKSMAMGGDTDDDLIDLRQAVDAFIYQMQLSLTNPRGSQVGIARWAGTSCSWNRGNTRPASQTLTPIPTSTPNGDTIIDINRGEYVLPCYDDASMLTYLSQNQGTLLRIAATSTPVAGSACPTAVAAPATPNPYSPGTMSQYACPLHWWDKPIGTVPQTYGTPATPTGINGDTWDGITATKLSNAIRIVNGDITGCYAWASSATGCPTNGRNNVGSEGQARKVLVIMTDGFSEVPNTNLPSNFPTYTATSGTSYSAPSSWNYEAIDLANRLKRGPDDVAGNLDDVEIYVVGFMCVPYDTNTSGVNKCRSKAAADGAVTSTGNTHPCPAGSMPPSSKFSYTASSVTPGVDEILNKVASSTAGTCDHYFPIAKDEGTQLPQLFRVLAGSIARGRLQ